MGRGKLKMELVKKEKPRLVALKMRKEGLVKKIEQLTTLCDVPACMIIHDPTTNSSFVWPEDSAQVRRLIDSYKANPTAVKPYGLSDFFTGRQKNAEEELAKLLKKNAETKYDDSLDLMDESQLRELGAALRGKAQAVRSRIEFLKREAMVKKENDVVLNLDEIEEIDQDDIFSAADDVMAAMVKKENGVVLDLEELEHIDQDDIFSAADDFMAAMVKKENNVFIDLDEVEEIDQDDVFSAADDVMAAMVKENDVFIDLDEIEDVDEDDIFSAMSANTQLPVPDYYCPLPLNLPTPFMDHSYLNYVNENVNWCADQNLSCSSMDVNQKVKWCDRNLNCSSMDVN